MLRISVHEGPNQLVFELEGRLAGAWVMELEECWRQTSSRLTNQSVFLQLNAVHHVDSSGKYLLALLRYKGVQLTGSGMAVTDLIRSIEEEWPVNGK